MIAAPGMRARARRHHGRTLAEVLVVLTLLGAGAAAVAPALPPLRADAGAPGVARLLAERLRDARATAVRRAVHVTVVLDPASGRVWRADGNDVPLRTDTALLARARAAGEVVLLEAGAPRVRWTFLPGGTVWGEPVVVRDAALALVVSVNEVTGVPHVAAR